MCTQRIWLLCPGSACWICVDGPPVARSLPPWLHPYFLLRAGSHCDAGHHAMCQLRKPGAECARACFVCDVRLAAANQPIQPRSPNKPAWTTRYCIGTLQRRRGEHAALLCCCSLRSLSAQQCCSTHSSLSKTLKSAHRVRLGGELLRTPRCAQNSSH